jgi:hypothetical protein
VPVVAAVDDAADEPAPRRRRRDDDAEPRPKKKKSNKGLIIGLSIGGVALLSLCCCGGGIGMYYGGVFDSLGGNPKVTLDNYMLLKDGMTLAQVEGIMGSGKAAGAGEVTEVFKTDPGTFGGGFGGGRGDQTARVQSAMEQAAGRGAVYRWKNGEDVLFVMFSGPPTAGGKAKFFYLRQKTGGATITNSNGSL